jgi:hypothetical protein
MAASLHCNLSRLGRLRLLHEIQNGMDDWIDPD